MSHDDSHSSHGPNYAEGTTLDAIIGFVGPLIAVLVIATIVLLTNSLNTLPSF